MESLIAALGLAAVHVGAGAFHVLDRVPRSRWLSAAAGVALAYVFVHLLPELAEVQRSINERGLLPMLARHSYLAALAGVVTYHSLEVLAHRRVRSRTGATTWDGVGTLHLGSYAALNVIIGYLLVERAGHEDASLWLFTVAMGVHLLVNDRGLRRHHGELYHRVGRWLLSAAIVAGWALGRTAAVGPTAVGLPLAFLAGGVVLNVLKEELPGDRESRPLPLVAAGALYTAVLLAV